MRPTALATAAPAALTACATAAPVAASPDLALPGERHLRNVVQLTFGSRPGETNVFVAGWVE